MIRNLRSRHRKMTSILFSLAAAVLVAGLVSRKPIPSMEGENLPFFEDQDPQRFTTLSTFPWEGEGWHLDLTLFRRGDDRMLLELQPRSAVQKPDVLVYLGDGGSDGYLLGHLKGLEGRRFLLPVGKDSGRVTLTLFSLAHGESVAKKSLDLPATRKE